MNNLYLSGRFAFTPECVVPKGVKNVNKMAAIGPNPSKFLMAPVYDPYVVRVVGTTSYPICISTE